MRQVGRIRSVAQTPVHPSQQPVVMVAVQLLEFLRHTLRSTHDLARS
jgi:hypothetical protein